MSLTKSQIYIRTTWTTKYRRKLILKEFENQLLDFIKKELTYLKCTPVFLDCTSNEVQCIFLLNPSKELANVIKQIKGSSAHLINHSRLAKYIFSWQKGYHASSIDPKMVKEMRIKTGSENNEV